MQRGAIILCGGRSTRMGGDKAMLPFGTGEVLLQRVVRLLSEAVPVGNIVVVAARDQKLPSLPTTVQVTFDRHADRGPLEGLATGFGALGTRVDAVYASGCDAPLLKPAFVEQMFWNLEQSDAAIPVDSQRSYPLAAVYRISLLPRIRTMLDDGVRALQTLSELDGARSVPTEQLIAVDPQLATLEKCNTRADYEAALVRCGCIH